MMLVGMRESKAVRRQVLDFIESVEDRALEITPPVPAPVSSDPLLASMQMMMTIRQEQLNYQDILGRQETRLSNLEHISDTFGCDPGFRPWKELHAEYGGLLPREPFKDILKYLGIESRVYQTGDDRHSKSTSFREHNVEILVDAFIDELEYNSPHFSFHHGMERKLKFSVPKRLGDKS